jgi:DNA replication and repair protein RecF
MYLNRLVLDEFRTYKHLDLEIPSAGMRIVGRNASGKTSVLEALVMLSTTRSSRASADRDVVRWESGSDYGVNPYSRLQGTVTSQVGTQEVGISLELDPEGSSVVRKQFLLSGDPVRAHDLIGVLKTVLFSPEDVLLVSGSPSDRRRQIDILISQIDRSYLSALSRYMRVLPQRNQLLKRFSRERRSARDIPAITEISFWDEELVSSGALVMAARWLAAARIAEMVTARSKVLVSDAAIGFAYNPRLDLAGIPPGDISQDELQQHVAGLFHDAIEEARFDEFRRGMTLVGPHRDDFTFLIEGRSLASFGSRGQQRLGVVAYRLAEIDMLEQRSGERPVLLLDDVLSELDVVHRDMLIEEIVRCGCQLMLTSTEEEMLSHPMLAGLELAEASSGGIARP